MLKYARTKQPSANFRSGFSLIEALIATMIMGIAFTGVYSLTIFSARQVTNSHARENMQIVANQIVEVIESDTANLTSYAGTLSTCTAPAGGVTTKHIVRKFDWCRRLNATVGTAFPGDVRTITVDTISGARVLTITLTSSNNANKIIVKRAYE